MAILLNLVKYKQTLPWHIPSKLILVGTRSHVTVSPRYKAHKLVRRFRDLNHCWQVCYNGYSPPFYWRHNAGHTGSNITTQPQCQVSHNNNKEQHQKQHGATVTFNVRNFQPQTRSLNLNQSLRNKTTMHGRRGKIKHWCDRCVRFAFLAKHQRTTQLNRG